jgi:hypothetical protein
VIASLQTQTAPDGAARAKFLQGKTKSFVVDYFDLRLSGFLPHPAQPPQQSAQSQPVLPLTRRIIAEISTPRTITAHTTMATISIGSI